MNTWRGVMADVVAATRRLTAAPGFSAVCILTLALGIGGNTAVFTLIDRVILKPLPVPRPGELYRVGSTNACCVNSGLQREFSLFSYDLYRHLRDAVPEIPALAAFQANVGSFVIGRVEADTPPETLRGSFVSGNYFEMLGIKPARGRLLLVEDDRPEADPVAVISYRAWRDRYGMAPDISGRSIAINGVAATIAGVAPETFYGETLRPEPPDVWVPLAHEPRLRPQARLLENRSSHWLYVIGRIPPGVDAGSFDGRLTTALQQWITANLVLREEDRPRIAEQHTRLVSAAAGVRTMRDEVAPSLKLLQVMAAAVLLIACANLANLLIVRGLARRTETAVRVALGAPRVRLVRQFLVESLLLASLGGIAGVFLSFVAAQAIVDLAFRGVSFIPVDASPTPSVLLFAVAVSLVTGIVFGVAPALVASKTDPIDAMRGAGRSTGSGGSRFRRTLVSAQIALSLVLLTGAALLAKSLAQLQAQDFGIRIDQRYVVDVLPTFGTAGPEELEGVYTRIVSRLEEIPGVTRAAMSLYSPMSGDNWASGIVVEGRDLNERLQASWNRVTPGYFETVGTPVLRGRGILPQDGPGAPLVAVVSQTFARRFFGDGDPIGRRIGFSGSGSRLEYAIVGIVGDAKYQDARADAHATFFMPFLQTPPVADGAPVRLNRSHHPQAIALHVAGGAGQLEPLVRRALAEADPRVTVMNVRSMADQVAGHFNIDRLIARVAMAFGAVALLLACLGIYGITAASVTRRTREIGIRIAIGASPRGVLATVLRGGVLQLAAGLAVGVPAALAAGRWLEATLFGVKGHDPVSLLLAALVLSVCAVAAVLIPARRAARLDPVRALRLD